MALGRVLPKLLVDEHSELTNPRVLNFTLLSPLHSTVSPSLEHHEEVEGDVATRYKLLKLARQLFKLLFAVTILFQVYQRVISVFLPFIFLP